MIPLNPFIVGSRLLNTSRATSGAAKGVSAADANNLTKVMSTDFHIQGNGEMEAFLKWVQGCLSKKGDSYKLDTTSPGANQHIGKLLNSKLQDVISDIVANM